MTTVILLFALALAIPITVALMTLRARRRERERVLARMAYVLPARLRGDVAEVDIR